MKLAPRKHRLKDISGVESAVSLTCAYYGVKLIYKEDYSALALCDFRKDGFQSFLKFASEFCARDK